MGFFLTFLNSSLGRAAVVGLMFAAVLASCGVQTARLKHAKADLGAAVAAQTDPHTKMKWEAEYELSAANLGTCKADRDAFKGDFDAQTRATEAAKAQTDLRDAAIASARQAAQKSALAAQSAGNLLAAFQAKGGDTCARLLDVDQKVKELSR